MSFLTLSIQCESDNHTGCPGGEHQPGIIGGWDCSCECHRRPAEPKGHDVEDPS